MLKKEIALDKKTTYEGRIFNVEVSNVICPNGVKSLRECVKPHAIASAILAEIDDCFIIENQYRFPIDDFVKEIPAGKCDKNEDPLITAYRELEEETGYKANKMEFLGIYYPSIGFSNEEIYVYFAHDLVETKTHFDVDEDIEIELISKQKVFDMVKNGEIKDGKTTFALLHYKLRKDKQ